MSFLSTKVVLYLEANGKNRNLIGRGADNAKVQLFNDGDGDYIKVWNVDGLAQPTEEQLNALESQADTLEANNQVIRTRKNLYGTPEQQIEKIIENGLDAEISRVNQIKTENPKT